MHNKIGDLAGKKKDSYTLKLYKRNSFIMKKLIFFRSSDKIIHTAFETTKRHELWPRSVRYESVKRKVSIDSPPPVKE